MRNYYFDFLRGIAIMMVIAIHTSMNMDFNSLSGHINIFVRQIFNCAVPLFLAISGFFLAKIDLSNRDKVVIFWKKQIPKIYIPCLIWSLPLFVIHILKGSNPLGQLLLTLICGLSVYYFVALIIQYYILLPFLKKINVYKLLIISTIISFISILIITYLISIQNYSFPIIVYAGSCILWIVFFVSGIYISRYTSRNYSLIIPIILIVLGLILSYFETKWLYSYHHGGFGIKLSAFIYSLGVIFFLFSTKIEKYYKDKIILNQVIRNIGSVSFGIYLVHCYFIPFIPLSPYWVVRWLFTLTLSICFIMLVKRIFPHISYKYLGFF